MTKKVRLLGYIGPFLPWVPEVQGPGRKEVRFQEKLLYTAAAVFIFLVLSQLPLYGIGIDKTHDPFYWLRVIIASSRGTVMELGKRNIGGFR